MLVGCFPGNGNGLETETRALMQGMDARRLGDQEIRRSVDVRFELFRFDGGLSSFAFFYFLPAPC
jgi:hypothetical protein